MVKVKEDMTGWKMCEHGVPNSMLTVVKQVEDYVKPNGNRTAQWLCICGCENQTQVILRSDDIKSGKRLSCGCMFKKKSVWLDGIFEDDYGQYKIGFAHNTNSQIYVDLDDFDKVKEFCWTECNDNGFKTLQTRCDGKYVRMHTLLGYSRCDHIDRNELNNRKSNLRKCTQQENTMNRSISKANQSGVIGVGWHNATSKWRSRIKYNGNSIELGLFVDKNEAIRARLEAEKKYFGDFAPQKHLFEQYFV